jgi:hypothetical protein
MEISLKKIVFPCIAILVLAALSIPDIAKINHAVNEHKEFTCSEKSKVHLHEVEFECDFHKYHITTYFSPQLINYTLFTPNHVVKQNQNYYFLLSEFQQLHFSLRGPPISS